MLILSTSVIHRETGLQTKCHKQRCKQGTYVGPPSERFSDPQFEALT